MIDHEPDDLDRALDPRHVEDGGFTARVMSALPAPRRAAPRASILLAASALGVTAAVLSPASEHVMRLVQALASAEHRMSAIVVLVSLFAVLLGSALQTATE